MTLLSVEDLAVSFGDAIPAPAVRGISFAVERGRSVGIVGASGSGKSVTALAIMGLLSESASARGHIRLDREDLLAFGEDEMCRVRGRRIAMIFQEPMTSLNPVQTIGAQIAETIALHRGLRGPDQWDEAAALLDRVGLEGRARLRSYPHELSGGQRQRAMIAMAIAGEPELLIADEPTTALDVTVQAQILTLLRELVREREMALLVISHDFGVIAEVADEILVMNEGRIVERGATRALFARRRDPYSERLFNAMPRLGAHAEEEGRRKAEEQTGGAPVLALRNVTRDFPLGRPRPFVRQTWLRAVDGVTLEMNGDRNLGIVGESGSGKTTLARAIMGLDRAAEGEIRVLGKNLAALGREALRRHRRHFQMVFQDPYASLDPRRRVGWSVAEPLALLDPVPDAEERRSRLARAFEAVGLRARDGERYPHTFSGGQRQRIAIARALITEPRLIVADEPVSSLDVLVQAQILALLRDLKRQRGVTLLLIAHDLAVIEAACDDVAVMYRGRIVEQGPVARVFRAPEHPYTRSLIAAVPRARALGVEIPQASGPS